MEREEKYKVHANGAILIGKRVEVDGFFGKPFRVVTHFHSDHIYGLKYSIKRARGILATQPTIEALEALDLMPPNTKTLHIGYNKPISLGDEILTLIYSRHIIGSAQVLVESERGVRDGYTSDFKLPGMPIMKDLDTLVIDVTYGAPEMIRKFKYDIEERFVDFIMSLLSMGYPVTIFAYYGKMQETMEILRKYGVNAPFLMSTKAYQLTRVSVRHGMKITDFFEESSEEAKEIKKTRWYINFVHYNSKRERGHKTYQVYLTGWIFDRPIKEIDYSGWRYVIGFSDHSDFEDTIYYVEEARPRNLVIDSTRSSYKIASAFYREVAKRFPNINVILPPVSRKRPLIRED